MRIFLLCSLSLFLFSCASIPPTAPRKGTKPLRSGLTVANTTAKDAKAELAKQGDDAVIYATSLPAPGTNDRPDTPTRTLPFEFNPKKPTKKTTPKPPENNTAKPLMSVPPPISTDTKNNATTPITPPPKLPKKPTSPEKKKKTDTKKPSKKTTP